MTENPAQTRLIAVTNHIKEKDASDNLTAVLLTLQTEERPRTLEL